MNTTERLAFTGWHRLSARLPSRPIGQAESEGEAWAVVLTSTAGGGMTLAASQCDAIERLDTRRRSWNSA
jgi:hypothetical protein